MWIRVRDDLVNMSTVRAIGISRGQQDKYVLHFPQADGQATIHIPFDTEEEAKAALTAIQEALEVILQFPKPVE